MLSAVRAPANAPRRGEIEPRVLFASLVSACLLGLAITAWMLSRSPLPEEGDAHRASRAPTASLAPLRPPAARRADAGSAPPPVVEASPRGGGVVEEPVLQGWTLRGTVVAYPDGQPIADAEVDVSLDLPSDGLPEGGVTAERQVLRTDAEGAFRVRGLRAGRYLLVGSHPRFGRRRLEWRLPAPTVEDAVVWLGAPGAIHGTVRDHANEPMAAFPVHVRPLAGLSGARRVQTDPDGAYRVEGLVPGGYVVESSINWPGLSHRFPDLASSFPISPEARGAFQSRDPLAPSALLVTHAYPVSLRASGVAVVDFSQAEGTLRGTIRRGGGNPLAVTRIELVGEDGCLAGAHRRLTSLTAEDGRFAFVGVPAGSHRLRAWMGPSATQCIDLGSVRGGGSVPLDLDLPPSTIRVEVVLGTGERVQGLDLRSLRSSGGDARDPGSGVGEAWIVREGPLSADPEFRIRTGWNEESGRFVAPWIREGAYAVVVHVAGHGTGVVRGIAVTGASGDVDVRVSVPASGSVRLRARGRRGPAPADWRAVILDASERIPLVVLHQAAVAVGVHVGSDPVAVLFQAPLHQATVVPVVPTADGSEVEGRLEPIE